MVDDGTRLYRYDAFNRLKTVKRSSDHKTIGEYTGVYPPRRDAMGRRIQKVIPDLDGGTGGLTGTIPSGTWDYLYTGVQCIEERDPTGGPESTDAAIRQYVWGQYVDELIQQREIDPSDGSTIEDYYLLSDLLYRSVLLTKSDKTKHEAYDCDAYGNTLVYDTPGTGDNWFADDAGTTDNPKCQFIFTGRRYDPETSNLNTQIYFYRARYYHPALGRFISRDLIGYAGGMGLYEYVHSAPVLWIDPYGVEIRRVGKARSEILKEMTLGITRWGGKSDIEHSWRRRTLIWQQSGYTAGKIEYRVDAIEIGEGQRGGYCRKGTIVWQEDKTFELTRTKWARISVKWSYILGVGAAECLGEAFLDVAIALWGAGAGAYGAAKVLWVGKAIPVFGKVLLIQAPIYTVLGLGLREMGEFLDKRTKFDDRFNVEDKGTSDWQLIKEQVMDKTTDRFLPKEPWKCCEILRQELEPEIWPAVPPGNQTPAEEPVTR